MLEQYINVFGIMYERAEVWGETPRILRAYQKARGKEATRRDDLGWRKGPWGSEEGAGGNGKPDHAYQEVRTKEAANGGQSRLAEKVSGVGKRDR